MRTTRLLAISTIACMTTLMAGHAAAQRIDTRAYTCGQISATVQQYQSIVLQTGNYTYDRFVAYRSYCQGSQTAHRAFAPTADNPHCFIGYQCKERIFD